MTNRHRIQFPSHDAKDLEQDEITFRLIEGERQLELRFHDYDQIYLRPGLYEQLFYDRLKCTSPTKVGALLKDTLDSSHQNFSELRVLDLGAGNGMMGEVMNGYGVARMIGVDIIPEAKTACFAIAQPYTTSTTSPTLPALSLKLAKKLRTGRLIV